MKVAQKVMVLEDDEGNHYTLTPEILELCKVKDEAYDSEIEKMLKQEKQEDNVYINEVFPRFKFKGVYDRSKDKRIKKTFVPPRLKAVYGPVEPNP